MSLRTLWCRLSILCTGRYYFDMEDQPRQGRDAERSISETTKGPNPRGEDASHRCCDCDRNCDPAASAAAAAAAACRGRVDGEDIGFPAPERGGLRRTLGKSGRHRFGAQVVCSVHDGTCRKSYGGDRRRCRRGPGVHLPFGGVDSRWEVGGDHRSTT